jgi:hypothetical protein
MSEIEMGDGLHSGWIQCLITSIILTKALLIETTNLPHIGIFFLQPKEISVEGGGKGFIPLHLSKVGKY